MSDFEDAVIRELKFLRREVERLKVKERPTGGVTDHGLLTGLSDDDHPQYLLAATGKAADSDKLDGVDSSGFVNMSSAQTVGGTKTFSSIPVLPSTNPTLANQAIRKGYADATYRLASTAIDHGSLTGLGDNDHPQYLLTTGKAADSDKLDGLDSTAFGRPVFLTTPLTSTSWDGDTKTTTDRAIVDLSAVFGVPAGVKAVLMTVQTKGDTVNDYIRFGPNSTYNYALTCRTLVANVINIVSGVVPCDSNGDVYCYPSGTIEGVHVMIWGYWL